MKEGAIMNACSSIVRAKRKDDTMYSAKVIDRILWILFGVYGLAIILFYLLAPE